MTDTINAFTAATRIEGFANSFGDSGAEAVSVFVAQNTGGGRPERVRRGFFTGMALMIGLGLAMSLIMFVGARASMVLMLGEASPAAMDEGMAYLRWISVFYVLCFIGSAYVGLYRGMGWVSVPVIGSVLQQTIRVILAYTLAGPMGLAGVPWGWPAWPWPSARAGRPLCSIRRFYSGPKSAFVKMSNRFEKQGTFFDESVL